MAKTEGKHPGGRPTKYKPEYCLVVEALARLGWTEDRMAEKIGVALSTLALWKTNYKEFSDAIEEGSEQCCEPIVKKIRGSGTQRKRNKVTAHEYYKRYYEAHKLKYYQNAEIRRNMKQGVVCNLPTGIWDELKIYFNMSCAYCGDNTGPLHKDHVIPLSKGGPLLYGNVLPVCKRCNSSKHDEKMELWYKSQSYYDETRYVRIMEYIQSGKNI